MEPKRDKEEHGRDVWPICIRSPAVKPQLEGPSIL